MTETMMLTRMAKQLKLKQSQVNQVIQLLEDQNTVPFIARYRKEQTGALDEVAIQNIYETWQYQVNLVQRKEEVIRLIDEQGQLTTELHTNISSAAKLQDVEDLYRPFKKKRRTRATIAKDKGLEPMAKEMLQQSETWSKEDARTYVSHAQEVHSIDEAIQGAQDIIAEAVSDDAVSRKWIRALTERKGMLQTTKKSESVDDKGIYQMYEDYSEAVEQIVPHRVLAINRGEKQKVLKVELDVPQDEIIEKLCHKWVSDKSSPVVGWLEEAVTDGYKRLIKPSIERDIRKRLTETAEEQAIHIFSEN